MYGNTRTPFASVATADLHSQTPGQHHRQSAVASSTVSSGTTAAGVLGHSYYPNYHLYNVTGGHGHVGASAHSTGVGHGHTSTAATHGVHGSHGGHHGGGHVLVSSALAHRYAQAIADGTDYTTPVEVDELLRRRASGVERRGSNSSSRRESNSGQGGGLANGNDTSTGPPGKKQQRFEITKKLGAGTYGRVSLAIDHKAGEEVAVKVIRKSAIENPADLIRIRREIRIMSALKHPNIIEIREVFENDEKIILVMEYASGGELYDYVGKHGPLIEDEVRRLFREVVSAVYYCHRHGVAHRDLKLENILLDKDLGAKIADFGLSNYFTEYSQLRTFCGSPLYASPEIINGTPYRGPEVDCWSLGVLLYTLAYSSMPFDGRDFNRMARQIKRGAYYEPDPPSYPIRTTIISPEDRQKLLSTLAASMLVRSMLRVNPEKRANISEIAAHWWLNFDENGLAIADMPENQVIDDTPLWGRKETMKIQSFGEENEMFAEFTHLSDETRKKIEEFRRRRREAEWYLTECQTPLKKQSKKRSSSIVNDQQKRQSSQAVVAKQQSREASVAAASGAELVQAAGASMTKKESSVEVNKKLPPLPPTPPPVHQPKEEAQKKEAENDEKPPPSMEVKKRPSEKRITRTSMTDANKKLFTAAEIAAGEAGGLPDEQLLDNLSDPLNRLKALETRLHKQYQKEKAGMNRVGNVEMPLPEGVTIDESGTAIQRPVTLQFTERPPPAPTSSASSTPSSRKSKLNSLKMSVDDLVQEKRDTDKAVDNATAASLVSAVQEEANRLVNRLLEETMKGTVTPGLIERIQRSEAYRTETFLKEILESVLTAQTSKAAGAAMTATTPSTPIATTGGRPLRSRSKQSQSSLTRIPKSGSSSSSTAATAPLPDVIRQNSEKISKTVVAGPSPDIVAIAAVAEAAVASTAIVAPTPSTPPINPTAAASTPMKLIYETVPEDAELQLPQPVTDGVEAVGGDPPSTEASSEQEEDVCSTDFEDLEIDEDDEGARERLRGEEDSPAGSFASTHSQVGDLPEIRTFAPAEGGDPAAAAAAAAAAAGGAEAGGEGEDNPFLRGLSKRLSRGKYERSKYVLGRGVSIEESPRSSRRRLAAEKRAAAKGQGSLEEQETEGADEDGEPTVDDGAKSPRRRYSDGDKNHLNPSVNRDEWMQKSDSELGSNEDVVNSPPPNPDTRFHYEELEKKTAELVEEKEATTEKPVDKRRSSKDSQPSTPAPGTPAPVAVKASLQPQSSVEEETAANEAQADTLLNESQRRRQERAKTKKGLRTDIAPAPSQAPSEHQQPPSGANPDLPEAEPEKKVEKGEEEKKVTKKTSQANGPPPPSEPIVRDDVELATAKPIDEQPIPVEIFQKAEEPKEVPPKAEAPPALVKKSKDGKKKLRKTKSETAPLPPPPSPPEAPQHQEALEPAIPSPPTEPPAVQPDEQRKEHLVPNDPPPATAEQRRHSYRTAMENSLEKNNSQDGADKHATPKSPTTSTTTEFHAGLPRSLKYSQTPSGVVSAAGEPYWLQYAREETQRHQTQASPFHHGYGGTSSDYKSTAGHGYDDDYLKSYRSTYGAAASRDLSPPRTAGIGPSFRSHHSTAAPTAAVVDPTETTTGFGYSSQFASTGGATARGRKPRPLYHQKSSDELGVFHHEDPLTTAKRYATPSSTTTSNTGAGSGYTPTYSRRTTGTGDYYKSLYDDNVVYRRSHYDVPPPEPDDDWSRPSTDRDSHNDKESSGGKFRVFQPKGLMKRRSRSLDKSQARRLLGTDDGDDDPLTSATSTHTNYHDTSAYHHYQPMSSRYESAASSGRPAAINDSKSSSAALRGILKKQPTFDGGTTTATSGAYGRYGEAERRNSGGDENRAMNFIERLRRHLSNEKSPEPPSEYGVNSSRNSTKHDSSMYTAANDHPVGGLDYGSSSIYNSEALDGRPKSKRNLMHSGRRRTAEIRYGATDPYADDYHYGVADSRSKRAVSPIDKLKGFFTGSSATKGQPSGGSTSVGGPSYHYSATTSPYAPYQPGAPSSTTNPRDLGTTNSNNYGGGYSSSRKPYQSGAGGGGYRPTSTYAPSSTNRYWHDDSSSLY